MKRAILILVLIILLVVSPVIAGSDIALKPGTTTLEKTSITMDKGIVVFITTDSKLGATTTTLIDGKTFLPITTLEKSASLVWQVSGVKMEYAYNGQRLKETITIDRDKIISFPITLGKDSKLIPWYGGQWKIVSSTSGDTMQGIVIEKPYGIDALGKRVEMEYTYTDGKLNLVYNRTITTYTYSEVTTPEHFDPINGTTIAESRSVVATPVYSEITYPLVIDPTWVVVGDREECTDCAPGYTIVRWTTTGTTTWTPPTGVTSVEYLVVAGGGGGGTESATYATSGGGGGAGGLLENSATKNLAVSSLYAEVIVVGGGGAADTKGSNSSIKQASSHTDVEAEGGGYGGAYLATKNGGSGGSGGGAAFDGTVGTGSQGRNGGTGKTADPYTGGGGGGKTGLGGNAGANGGIGGVGYDASTIYGSTLLVAGGGGGGAGSTGSAGTATYGGGSGGASQTAGNPGTANTGGGGGGGGYAYLMVDRAGGSGGSGIVIIRYATIDTTPPNSITGLTNNTGKCDEIKWSWTNPTSTDYAYLYTMKNNIFMSNYTNSTTTVNWTGLTGLTTFSSKTVDLSGNINATWINGTATPSVCPTPTPTPTPVPTPTTQGWQPQINPTTEKKMDPWSWVKEYWWLPVLLAALMIIFGRR